MMLSPQEPSLSEETQGCRKLPQGSLLENEAFSRHDHLRVAEEAYREGYANRVAAIEREYSCAPLVAEILASRGFEVGTTLTNFLARSIEAFPPVRALKGIEEAAKTLLDAAREGRKVGVICDYDVDGATSAGQFMLLCEALGCPLEIVATDRFHGGYGLTHDRVQEVHDRGCEILVALDIGTRGHEHLDYASGLGLTTIILDHHDIPEDAGNPPCDIFLNPKQEGCGFGHGELCASALTNFLARVTREVLSESPNPEDRERAKVIPLGVMTQLAACGTVADVMALEGINRALVYEGLRSLYREGSVGLDALKEVAGVSGVVDARAIAFQLGPRINAVGRILEEDLPGVLYAVQLFVEQDPDAARELSAVLQRENSRRRTMQASLMRAAVKQVETMRGSEGSLPPVLLVEGSEYHAGLAGIIAARLADRYERPALVAVGPDKEGRYRGSARSVPGVHITQALEHVHEHLYHFGGHEAAAGFSFFEHSLESFKKALELEVGRQQATSPWQPTIEADIGTTLARLTEGGRALLDECEVFEPCGRYNPAPRFLIEDVLVVGVTEHKGRHKEVLFRQGDALMVGMVWQFADKKLPLMPGDRLDMVVEIALDERHRFQPTSHGIRLDVLAGEKHR